MPSAKSTLVWFRCDLRVADNPALQAAIETGQPILPVFIFDPEADEDWKPGGASQWWLHHALEQLQADLSAIGLSLSLHRGDTANIIRKLIGSNHASHVYWNRRYEPHIIKRDKELKLNLTNNGVRAKSFNAGLLFEPWTIKNKSGKPFQVFTPYWRHCASLKIPSPTVVDTSEAKATKNIPKSLDIEQLDLLPHLPWASGFSELWNPADLDVSSRIRQFLSSPIDDYSILRDRPDHLGTSLLSPFLSFGQIGPRQIMQMAQEAGESASESRYLSQIGWREFSYHLLYHFPHIPDQPLKAAYRDFPSHPDENLLGLWQEGKTGYPIVDAGMRQLWATGWMHNRVRMITASFLVKHLMQPWQSGARWFWDTLVDADLANNTQGWQWTAGCGADASPYFRVFNPITQGAKFDPKGEYTKRWIPELRDLPVKYLFSPWTAREHALQEAGIKLGVDYPEPIVSHFAGRNRALEAFARFQESRKR